MSGLHHVLVSFSGAAAVGVLEKSPSVLWPRCDFTWPNSPRLYTHVPPSRFQPAAGTGDVYYSVAARTSRLAPHSHCVARPAHHPESGNSHPRMCCLQLLHSLSTRRGASGDVLTVDFTCQPASANISRVLNLPCHANTFKRAWTIFAPLRACRPARAFARSARPS